uniref:C-methyltransferase n=1 Tax=Actinomadura madurae TaxID=1993 RepID=B0BLL8_9ACTN|nr:C-methyltransferase [Actinomadura madurae]
MSDGCKICGGAVRQVLDLGRQPRANAFIPPEEAEREFTFRLALDMCDVCTMVQLHEVVPQEMRYHGSYRYHASGSAGHRKHFEGVARDLLRTELAGADPFIVEIGCNDGVMLSTVAESGVRHLGVDPSANVTALAAERGVRVRTAFFDEGLAEEIRAADGPADVLYGANTVCHIAHLESLFRGAVRLLKPDGIFVFEEPYLGTILDRTAFDQIYDEHCYYFTARSVQAAAELFGLELVDVAPTPLHGGEIRYTLSPAGARRPSPAVQRMLDAEAVRRLADPATLTQFAHTIAGVRDDLLGLLREITAAGHTVAGYGAPGKAATATAFFGIGPELVPFVSDSTPAKQGLLVPGSHIPVRPPEEFRRARPDYALLFAWNHADEIMAKEREFRNAGGRWIRYVPDVHVV